jgi:hypothetical protein
VQREKAIREPLHEVGGGRGEEASASVSTLLLKKSSDRCRTWIASRAALKGSASSAGFSRPARR